MEDEQKLLESLNQLGNSSSDDLDDPSSLKQRRNAARLQSMHQSYRKMEKKKRFYHIEAEGLMRRQQACLENLVSDNSALQEIVDTYEIKDYRKQMDKLMDESKKYTGLIETETKRVNYLDAKIRESNSKALDSKRRMGGYTAGWKKHVTTQIRIQQNENRLQKANIDTNIVKGDMKMLKSKMSQLKQEQEFYTNVYQKLNAELNEWEEDIQQCIMDMNAMYADRSEYQDAITDLMEMADYKSIYSQWLLMEGWATQEPYSVKELELSQLDRHQTEDIRDDTAKPEPETLPKNTNLIRIKKSRTVNLRNISRTHYAKRSRAAYNFRPWVEIKAFGNVQELLNADKIAHVLPMIVDRQCKNAELFKQIQELVKEMEALDAARQGNIFDKPARLENSEVKASVGPRRFEADHMVASIVDSVRHLEIDEEAFSPIVTDLWKQILLVFKEAGCYIKDEEEGKQGSRELAIGSLFGSAEDFVDRISGASS